MSLRLGVARKHGLDETMADKVDHYEDSDLPEHQKVALLFTDAFITQPGAITTDLREQLHQHFSREQIAELMLDISKWSTQKIPVALGLDAPLRPDGLMEFDFDGEGKVLWGAPIG
ncbi:MAG TPA: hypothetical protein QGF35_08055 [Dehalococcoidia bacterium]|nr:hypothetical protein [Dehalococcoidia bacterium]